MAEEYVKVNGVWQKIGSSGSELNIEQNADKISINGTNLQIGTSSKVGLMSKERASFCTGYKVYPQEYIASDSSLTIRFGGIDYDETKDQTNIIGIDFPAIVLNETNPALNDGRPLPGIVTPAQWTTKADASALADLSSRVTALENIPNASGRSY